MFALYLYATRNAEAFMLQEMQGLEIGHSILIEFAEA